MCATGKMGGLAVSLFLRLVVLTATISVALGAAIWWGLGWPLLALPPTVIGVGIALSFASPWLLPVAAWLLPRRARRGARAAADR